MGLTVLLVASAPVSSEESTEAPRAKIAVADAPEVYHLQEPLLRLPCDADRLVGKS